jgi:uncharacterized protein involved in exopolysaccharide biosynthesis
VNQADSLRGDLFDLRTFLLSTWQRKTVIVALVGAGAVLAGAFAEFQTPKYRAETILAEADNGKSGGGLSALSGQFGNLASLAGVNLGKGTGTLEESLATITSNVVLYDFIERNDLLKVILESRWDKQKNQWRHGLFNHRDPTEWHAAQAFRKSILTVAEDKKTHLVKLIIEWKDPIQAKDWANDLVNATNLRIREHVITVSTRNLEYLNQQLEKAATVDLRQAISRLIETETKNAMVARGNDEYALKIIDPAVVPQEKYSPRITLIIILGAALGLLLGLGFAMILGPKRV